MNAKPPICCVAEKSAILTTPWLLRLQIFLRLASGQLCAQTLVSRQIPNLNAFSLQPSAYLPNKDIMGHSEKIIFLDRDGVINEDSDAYIKSPEEFFFIPQSPEAVALLNQNGFEVIIITNQSMIGREMVGLDALEAIFEKMTKGIAAAGGRIKDVFYCPHAPDQGCSCRKPLPGLIHQAQKKYAIDLGTTVMIGDSARDIECGINGGCGATCLVATGRGPSARKALKQKGITPDHFADNLYQAARWIIDGRS